MQSPDKNEPAWHQLIADLKARFPDHSEEAIEDKAYIAFSRQGSNYRLPYKESFQWRSLIKGLRERLPGYSEDAIEDKASIAFYRNGSLTPDIERAARLLNIKTLLQTKQKEGQVVYYQEDSPTRSPDSTSDATGEVLNHPSDGQAS